MTAVIGDELAHQSEPDKPIQPLHHEMPIPLDTQWTQLEPCAACRRKTRQTLHFRNESATRFTAKCMRCGSWNILTAAWGWSSEEVLPILIATLSGR